ncbi:hypothetical protein HELRODRAFT_194007 [Helobdella robusta]|uniref:Apple domain-containing protein n=1 Tax=Helobdella robusta TaxID=6412 RepID=T1FVK3_HELRO|nr:hypothetical protein HELRODRAFT_194007 [Helobdella robusta]ESN93648.1 hypothetical protein HELRODRAFT_194007 [Helobdella robusta]
MGGLPQSSATTVEQCQSACLSIKNCQYGFDWNAKNPSGSQCFVSTSATLGSNADTTHYDLVCTTTGGCTVTPIENTNSPGGVSQSFDTLDACKSGCLAKQDSTCKNGFDFNPSGSSGNKCYFSTSTATSTYTGVTHYNVNCVTTGCGFTPIENTNSPGGVSQSFDTLDACKSGCLAKQDSTCKNGFDFNPSGSSGNKCYFSTSTATSTYTGVTHYNINCVTTGQTTAMTTSFSGCTVTPIENTNSPGGVSQSFDTLDACKSGCLAKQDSTCKNGFDFNPSGSSGNKCYFSTSTATSTYTGVTHYKVNCVTTATCTFPEIANSFSPSGQQMTNITTLTACKDYCASTYTTYCKYGFDFNPSTSGCFISTSATVNVNGYPGVTHYNVTCTGVAIYRPGSVLLSKLFFNELTLILESLTVLCPRIVLAGNLTFTGKKAHPSGIFSDHGLVEASLPVTGPIAVWQEANNTNTAGGVEQTSATSLDMCKSQCFAAKDTTCKNGFDWDYSKSKCFFSTTSVTSASNGVSHFTYSSSVGCSWQIKNDTNTLGGIQQTATSLDACKASCAATTTSSCLYGFDWDVANSKCFFSTNSDLKSAPGVNHYTCLNATTTVPTTPGLNISTISNCTWTQNSNSNTAGGIKNSANDVESCKYNCVTMQTNKCQFGLDFDTAAADGSKCFFSTTSTVNIGVAAGVNHYNC